MKISAANLTASAIADMQSIAQ